MQQRNHTFLKYYNFHMTTPCPYILALFQMNLPCHKQIHTINYTTLHGYNFTESKPKYKCKQIYYVIAASEQHLFFVQAHCILECSNQLTIPTRALLPAFTFFDKSGIVTSCVLYRIPNCLIRTSCGLSHNI